MTTLSTSHSKRLTIFEGPDGGGKTTTARKYAELTGARYVHFGPMKNVKEGLARMYVEAMIPALLGYQDVVFDRCWMSEGPYGRAFRNGADRIGRVYERMLERVALRCGAVVVRCLPEWAIIRENFIQRKQDEYLETEEQLLHVYDSYTWMTSALPIIDFDYIKQRGTFFDPHLIDNYRAIIHSLDVQSAGFFGATNIIVGEAFAEVKNQEPFLQYPFVSFSGNGCSAWLTGQLEKMGVPEHDLLFVNADQHRLDEFLERAIEVVNEIPNGPKARVIALGNAAESRLNAVFDNSWMKDTWFFTKVPHPQSWLRFNSKQPYEPLQKALNKRGS